MRVLLADSENNIRYGLTAFLDEQSDIEVIGEAANASELEAQIQTMCPDLLLLSWEFPGEYINQLIRNIRITCPKLIVMVLSARTEVKRAVFNAGADIFFSKTDPPDQLLANIRSAWLGSNNTTHDFDHNDS